MSSATSDMEKPQMKKRASKKSNRSRTATPKPGKPNSGPKSSARTSRKHRSVDERAQILQLAAAEGLTGAQVAKRFGISQVTYYLWRKKAGAEAKRVPKPSPAILTTDSSLTTTVRTAVEARVREMLPEIVRSEVALALEVLFKRS